jgi:hypothetical protein
MDIGVDGPAIDASFGNMLAAAANGEQEEADEADDEERLQ